MKLSASMTIDASVPRVWDHILEKEKRIWHTEVRIEGTEHQYLKSTWVWPPTRSKGRVVEHFFEPEGGACKYTITFSDVGMHASITESALKSYIDDIEKSFGKAKGEPFSRTQQWEFVEFGCKQVRIAFGSVFKRTNDYIYTITKTIRNAEAFQGDSVSWPNDLSGRIKVWEFTAKWFGAIEEMPSGQRRIGERILDSECQRLRSEGYEELEKGQWWFSYRFRKPWSSN